MDTVSDSVGLKFVIAIVLVGIAMAGFFALVTVFRRRFPGGVFGAVPAFRGGSGFGGNGFFGGSRSRRDRIRIVEVVQVDPKRRAILIRRDDMEHLVLVGGPTDIVVETGIAAPYEAAEPEDEDVYDEPAHQAYEPEPVRPARPQPRSEPPRPVERQAAPAYQEWEDEDEDDDFDAGPGQYLRPRTPAPPAQPDVPLSTGIRPVTLARGIRPAGGGSSTYDSLDAEEAAIARELEAARRRTQVPTPQAAQITARSHDDFDDILAREMEERLEAAKRQARAQGDQQPRRAITTSRPPAPDQRGMQAGINRIFGDPGNDG